MASVSKYESKHHDVLVETSKVYRKNQMTIVRRIVRAIPYGLEMAIIGVAFPVLTSRLTGWSVVWPGLVVVLGAVLVRISRNDVVLKAREWWAKRTEEMYRDLEEIQRRYAELERFYQIGEAKIAHLSAALSTLEVVLKSDITALCKGSINRINSEIVGSTARDVDAIRTDLKLLCRYVCEILGSSDGHPLRCGVLIEDPAMRGTLIPVVVYDPTDPTYVSRQKYSASDFSGQLLHRFNESLGRPNWKQFTTVVIPDLDSVRADPSIVGMRPIVRRSHQEDYLKSIAGNVIYCRDHESRICVLGVLNIDSRESGAVQEQAYRSVQPYLYPAFRLFASRLLLIQGESDLIHRIWQT